MIVSANRINDYSFKPGYGELIEFKKKFGSIAIARGEGFTLSFYQDVPFVVIKDRQYTIQRKIYTSKHTIEFETATSILNRFGLAICVDNSEILDKTQGLISKKSTNLDYDKKGFKTQGIPQIFGVYKLNGGAKVVINSINGDYDFNTDLFYGVFDIQDYDDFLIENAIL